MNKGEDEYCFPMRRLGLREDNSDLRTVRMPEGFSLEINPWLAWKVGEILVDLPKTMKEALPANVERVLREMGVEEDFKIFHSLEVDTYNVRKGKWREFNWDEFFVLHGIRISEPIIIIGEKEYWLIGRGDAIRKNIRTLSTTRRENVGQSLKQWSEGGKCAIGGRKFWVIEGLDRKLEELEKCLVIHSLRIRVKVAIEGVGDAVCNFSVYLPSGGARENWGNQGDWEMLLENKRSPEPGLSLEEAIKKLKIAAEKAERKKQEKIRQK